MVTPSRSDARPALSRLRDESAFGLVELLVALLVLNVGILAMLAAFSSGTGALRKASTTSTAASLAEVTMEQFRGMRWEAIPLGSASAEQSGTDGRLYRIHTDVLERSEDPVVAPGTAGIGRAVKVVKVRVVDVETGRTVITQESTFDEAVGA